MELQKKSIYNVSAVNKTKVVMTYNISLDGTIQVKTALINTDSNLPILPRFGTNLIINMLYDWVWGHMKTIKIEIRLS